MSNSESAHAAGANFDEMTSAEKEAFFANIALASPTITPDAYEFFAFVVNGEVSVVFIASKDSMQDYIDALSSNPLIVKLATAQKNVVGVGWAYEEQTNEFSQPE